MDQSIKVTNVHGAWSVQPLGCEANLFISGRAAELSARRLAQRLAHWGCTAQVIIHDRADGVIGVFTYSANVLTPTWPSPRQLQHGAGYTIANTCAR
jgi:hypothetical protein